MSQIDTLITIIAIFIQYMGVKEINKKRLVYSKLDEKNHENYGKIVKLLYL